LHEPIGSAHFAFVVIIAAPGCGGPRWAICSSSIIEAHSGTAILTMAVGGEELAAFLYGGLYEFVKIGIRNP